MVAFDRQRLKTPNAFGQPTFLVDGYVAGTWRITRERDTATLHVTPFERLSDPDRAAVVQEGERLLGFAAADAPLHDLEVEA